MAYKHLFFDLDRTLWDFDENSYQALTDIYSKYHLKQKGVTNKKVFISKYKMHNERLWSLYRRDEITQSDLRRNRFFLTLSDFGIEDYFLSDQIGEEYIQICPRKTLLFPFTFDILEYLKDRYSLHIITNGFEETQQIKLEYSRLLPYFNQIVTSEKTGYKKPNPLIFAYALDLVGAKKQESVYIGDDLIVDIEGCQSFGIDGVYFNPAQKKHNQIPKFEISCLSELKILF